MPLSLVPMDAAAYAAWLAIIVPEYAAEKVANGTWPAAEALARSRDSIGSLLPQGLATPEQHLYVLRPEDGVPEVGYLWFGRKEQTAYLYDIYIYPEHRRRGYGRQAMQGLERAAAALGFSTISLHVFGQNETAAALYRSLGYAVTDLTMRKVLSPA
jgi:ribosomal protein S18 acetylase RimI-like enzyme